MRVKISILFVFILLFLFPRNSFAVEYSITDVNIDAYLQENGNVKVTETHRYDFDGEFNGITRLLIPKEGSDITEFSATENNSSLKIEQEDHLYKIHRKGEDEEITVTLNYVIKDGIEVYQDVVQFYWPFFDDRNESTYENLSITVYPPKETKDVIAFGYDEAFLKERILDDGTVIFNYGEVPSETNGDIRVAYDASIFSTAYLTADKPMKDEILAEKEELLKAEEKRLEAQATLSMIAKIGLSAFTLIILILVLKNWIVARTKRIAITRELTTDPVLPQQSMSLPATIYFTNNQYLPPQAMAAALLDLVRQGYVRKNADDKFELLHQNGAKNHESILIKWLFEIIGKDGRFSFDDLTAYTKRKKNHVTYKSFITEWTEAVKNEVKEHSYYENRKKYRTILALSSLILAPFLFLFPIYGLIGAFAVTLLLFLFVIFYAIFYNPRTWEGARVYFEWIYFKNRFRMISLPEWEKWSEDDQMRAYIYGLGVKAKSIVKKNEELVDALTPNYGGYHSYRTSDIYTMTYIGSDASAHFDSANNEVGSSSSSSSSSSGGGTGGGGGGSGAF